MCLNCIIDMHRKRENLTRICFFSEVKMRGSLSDVYIGDVIEYAARFLICIALSIKVASGISYIPYH
jgi:hypothetical protein